MEKALDTSDIGYILNMNEKYGLYGNHNKVVKPGDVDEKHYQFKPHFSMDAVVIDGDYWAYTWGDLDAPTYLPAGGCKETTDPTGWWPTLRLSRLAKGFSCRSGQSQSTGIDYKKPLIWDQVTCRRDTKPMNRAQVTFQIKTPLTFKFEGVDVTIPARVIRFDIEPTNKTQEAVISVNRWTNVELTDYLTDIARDLANSRGSKVWGGFRKSLYREIFMALKNDKRADGSDILSFVVEFPDGSYSLEQCHYWRVLGYWSLDTIPRAKMSTVSHPLDDELRYYFNPSMGQYVIDLGDMELINQLKCDINNSEYMTVGKLVKRLRELPEGTVVKYLTNPTSHRGSANELCYRISDETILASTLANSIEDDIGVTFHHWKGNTLTPTQYTPVVITPKEDNHYYSADDNFVGIADEGTYLLEPRK